GRMAAGYGPTRMPFVAPVSALSCRPIGSLVMSNAAHLIMVVDDDESVRTSLKRLLRSAGFEARTFSSTEQLLAHGRPPEPCCLLLDVRMPGMDGLEFQRSLLDR